MYTRTHTHTQARTHTTKFSGHVVRFFFFAVFFSPLRHSCFDEKETIWCTYSLQHWWYTETSTVIAHNRDVTAPMHAHTQRFSVTWQAQSVSGWIEIHSLRSDPTFFFHVVPRCVVMVTRRQSPEEAWPAKFSNMRAIISHVGFSAVHTFERMHDSTHNVKTRTHSEWK